MNPLDCPPNNITDLAEPAERIGDLRQAALCAAAFAKVEIGDRFCGKVAMAMMTYLRNLNDKSWSPVEIDVMLCIAVDTYMAAEK